MKNKIRIAGATERQPTEVYPVHPNRDLRAATAAALNAGGPLPRPNIECGHYRQDTGNGTYMPLHAAWLVIPGAGYRMLLAVKPWDTEKMRDGRADRPWVAARREEV